MRSKILASCFIVLASVSSAAAQTKTESPPPPARYGVRDGSFDILRDEKTIWRDLFRIQHDETRWLLPIIAASVVAVSTDNFAVNALPTSKTIETGSHAVSSLGAPYPLFVAASSMYLFGRFTQDRRLAETGVLGTQALVHSIIMTAAVASATNRRGPLDGSADRGGFWSGGRALPSGHASMFWALSTVVAEQYHDRPLLRYGAYSLATAVSVSRFTGGTHFPSDALASTVIGYFVGRFVVHRHGAARD